MEVVSTFCPCAGSQAILRNLFKHTSHDDDSIVIAHTTKSDYVISRLHLLSSLGCFVLACDATIDGNFLCKKKETWNKSACRTKRERFMGMWWLAEKPSSRQSFDCVWACENNQTKICFNSELQPKAI